MYSNEHSPEQSVEDSLRVIAEEVRAHIESLKDNDYDVCEGAAEALIQMGARVIPALIEATKDSDTEVRLGVAYAMGQIGDARAVSALIEAIKDSDASVRRRAAYALGKIGDARAVPALIETIKDSDVSLRWRAAEALGNVGDACAVAALLEALKDRDIGVGSLAANALRKIGDGQTLPLRVLVNAILTPAERLDTLDALMRLQWMDSTFGLHYPLPSIPAYCRDLVRRVGVDDAVKEGAAAVLAEIKNRSDRAADSTEVEHGRSQ